MSNEKRSQLFGFITSVIMLIVAIILYFSGNIDKAIFFMLLAIYFTIGANFSYYSNKE